GLGIGPESYAYSWLYNQGTQTPVENNQRETGYEIVHTAYYTKRSSGIFTHPAHAAYYLEYLLPLALAYLVTVRRAGYRLLFVTLLALGSIALYLTFSRSGLVGFAISFIVFLLTAAWSRAMSGRSVVHCIAVLAIALTVTAPFLIYSFSARDTMSKRFELMSEGLATFSRRPLFGAGLNNSSTVVEGSIRISTTAKGPEIRIQVIHNYYLIMLIEVGIVGCVLFFTFFCHIAWTALRYMREAEDMIKALLVGIVPALTAIAVHNLGDPFGGHVVVAMLWLYAGLILAAVRCVRTDAAAPPMSGQLARAARP
ncbi:MAG TPA: O-antigen ligase family protein, partial [Gammaproteobacteria bacterium]|nr:O-antigen ligase family protein [Gammaproteobacteria bacterium]